MALSPEIAAAMKLGIECCRRGDWNEGLHHLGKVTEKGETTEGLPGLFYSYLGFGIPAVVAGILTVHGPGLLGAAAIYGVAVIVLALFALAALIRVQRKAAAESVR